MSVPEQRVERMIEPKQVTARLSPASLAAALMLIAGVTTAAGLPDITIRYVSFAAMIAAIVSGVVAVRYGPAWVRAVSAVVAVIALMLGSTFFGLTYS